MSCRNFTRFKRPDMGMEVDMFEGAVRVLLCLLCKVITLSGDCECDKDGCSIAIEHRAFPSPYVVAKRWLAGRGALFGESNLDLMPTIQKH